MRPWYLLPSGNPRRVFTCVQCGGKYDLSDPAKIASIMGVLLGTGPAIVVVGKIARPGGAGWILLGTVAAAAVFLTITLTVARLALRLVAKS